MRIGPVQGLKEEKAEELTKLTVSFPTDQYLLFLIFCGTFFGGRKCSWKSKFQSQPSSDRQGSISLLLRSCGRVQNKTSSWSSEVRDIFKDRKGKERRIQMEARWNMIRKGAAIHNSGILFLRKEEKEWSRSLCWEVISRQVGLIIVLEKHAAKTRTRVSQVRY